MGLLFNPFTYMQVLNIDFGYTPGGIDAITLVFCPLAGFLADVQFSRFRMILTGSYVVLFSMVLIILAEGLEVPNVYHFLIQNGTRSYENLFWTGLSLSSLFGVFLIIGFIGFIANIIQFGLDHLHDSPTEDQSLFIHWYVCIFYAYILSSSKVSEILLNLSQPFVKYLLITLTFVVPSLLVVLLTVVYFAEEVVHNRC